MSGVEPQRSAPLNFEEIEDTKWHGVPPAGERPAPGRFLFLFQITMVLLIEFIIWGLYRYLTAPIYGQFGTFWFYVGHIIAAPTIHLGPILLYWKFIRKERLFYRDDPENGGHLSFVFGPFKMTRKFLLSAVLMGLLGGIMWRVIEMLIWDTTSIFLGGSRIGTLTLFDIFSTDSVGIFFLMTFVMFFVVGPVEEFEFRSFVHDQSQRVLPKWAALIFSSIFFGLSHIPIAVFIYKYNVTELFFAEIGWMTAGATFGALYLWSRNIFACIVMHGIGNWQLSVFLWQSHTLGIGLSETEGFIASFITSILSNGIMIGIFYLIHRLYWGPQRRGEAAFSGKLFKLQSFIFSHDNGTKSIYRTGTILAATTVLLLSVMVAGTLTVGSDNFAALGPEVKTTEDKALDLAEYTTTKETLREEKAFAVSESYQLTIPSSVDRIVKGATLTITWTDETTPPGRPRIRPYTNQPDSFSATLSAFNQTITDEAENPIGGEGRVTVSISVNDTDIIDSIGNYTINADITLVEAGIWTTFGLLGLVDSGNDCSISIDVEYLVPKASEGETPSPKL